MTKAPMLAFVPSGVGRSASDGSGTDAPADLVPPTNLAELADLIRRDQPRSRNVPALLDYMHAHPKATFRELADKVHGAEVDDDAIKRTIVAARKAIVAAGLPFRLSVSKGVLDRKRVDEGNGTSPETTPET
jgi:hypothetical protein